MDLQTSLLLNFNYFHHDNKRMDELRLLTMELEDTRHHAQEHLRAKDQEIAHLKDQLAAAIKDKDEALQKYQKLIYDNALSSSDCGESIVSSPYHLLPPQPPTAAAEELPLIIDRPLPEKGKLLKAVVEAGPLLQTLLLAGPLPEWRHPPPPLDTYQIPPPPVAVPSPLNIENIGNCRAINRKRGLMEVGCSGVDELNYQRIFFL